MWVRRLLQSLKKIQGWCCYEYDSGTGHWQILWRVSLGTVDCYTETNGELFKNGNLKYLCGKYESIIGPAFAAMYNAVTGYSEDFREDGKAFAIQQGFWFPPIIRISRKNMNCLLVLL